MFHEQYKALAYYINAPASLQFFFKFTKVRNLIQRLQENYGFNKQINLLKKSLKTFNQSILNKNLRVLFCQFVNTAQDNSQ